MSQSNSNVLPETIHPEQRLNIGAVMVLTGTKKSKIYADVAAGKFPAPERDGPRCNRWRAGDVLDHLASKRVPA